MKTTLVDAVDTFVVDGEICKPIYKLLEEYPDRKIVVTNASDEEKVKFGLMNLPYEMFTLNHKPDKTDLEYFKKLFENYGFSADDVIYFEHNTEVVEISKSLGITSRYYDPQKKTSKH